MSYNFKHKEETVDGKKHIRVSVELPPRHGAEPIKTCYGSNVVEFLTKELNLDFKRFVEGGSDLARNDLTPAERSQTWLAELHSKPSDKPTPKAAAKTTTQPRRRRRSAAKTATPTNPVDTKES